jgi:hypothetical protein
VTVFALLPDPDADASGGADGHDIHLLPLNGLWHVTIGDLLSQTLCHSCLADTRLSNQARVVLCTPAQNLDHTLDLLLAANHWVQLAL